MSLKSKNKLNGNTVELEIEISKESFEKAVSAAYKKNVARMNIPGFRRGKAPRSIVEKMYGKGVFYDDALNALIPEAFEEALKEADEKPVGQPEFDVVSLEGDVVVKATFPIKPEVTVKNYKGIEVTRTAAPVTDEELDAEIAQVRSRNARMIEITDRAAQNGDIAVIDYEGFCDGVAFEGGKGEKYNLTLGSGSFIPGFEDQIVGHGAGDSFDVNVTFPAEYHAPELAGKEATFKTVLHEIKLNELPELDDDFAKDVSEFDTFEEYKNDVKIKLEEKHAQAADREVENKLVEVLVENLEADIPEAMFQTEAENQVRDYDNSLRMNGLDLNTYLKYTGMTLDQLRAQMRPRAESQVKTRLALEKIAELEAITVSDEDVEKEIEKIASAYNIPVDEVKKQVTADMISDDIKVGKAVEFVKANAVITEAEAEVAPAPEKKKTTRKKTAKTAKAEKPEAEGEAE